MVLALIKLFLSNCNPKQKLGISFSVKQLAVGLKEFYCLSDVGELAAHTNCHQSVLNRIQLGRKRLDKFAMQFQKVAVFINIKRLVSAVLQKSLCNLMPKPKNLVNLVLESIFIEKDLGKEKTSILLFFVENSDLVSLTCQCRVLAGVHLEHIDNTLLEHFNLSL